MTADGAPAIELEELWRSYQVAGEALHALKGVSLRIPAGGYLAVMGPSGSGKSTLLSVLGCLDRPTRGSYRLGVEEEDHGHPESGDAEGNSLRGDPGVVGPHGAGE